MTHIATLLQKIVPYAFLLIGFGYLSAQDLDEEEIPSIEMVLESNQLILSGLETRTHLPAPSSDSAYIYQIGSDNTGNLRIAGSNNELKLMQHGNANRANINISGKSVVHNTLQNGNGNVLLEYGNTPHLNLERQILQNGNNQNLVIYGSNSLTESIELNMQGDSQALTIRSFN